MKVLLIKDVYKLGHAGDVKKVANGYGRNYLIPQGLAVLATPGALKQADHIRSQADAKRALLNQEMSGVAEILSGLSLNFAAKAGETGKLYGSVTTQMIADAIKKQSQVEVDRRQIDHSPIRTLGVHNVQVRLTIDLVPEVTVVVYREGESPESALKALEAEAEMEAEAATEIEAEAPSEEAGEMETAEIDVEVEPAPEHKAEVSSESEE